MPVATTAASAPSPEISAAPRTHETPEDEAQLIARLAAFFKQMNQVVLGKERQIELCVVCLLAGGHLLIEDVPGVGKTTLAQAMSQLLGLAFGRVQFTSDLMPSDILGVHMLDAPTQRFVFHPGPVFNPVLLADEINRSSPRTQSALLQCMEEAQVTLEGQSHALPTPFFVMATQNPQEQLGTYALPESQLDRFLMAVPLGYPSPEAERALLKRGSRHTAWRDLSPVMHAPHVLALQALAARTAVSDGVLDYVQALLAATRSGQWFAHGLSPRAGLAVLHAAKAHAFLAGRGHVSPDDVLAVFPACAVHRLSPLPEHTLAPHTPVQAHVRAQVQLMLRSVDIVGAA